MITFLCLTPLRFFFSAATTLQPRWSFDAFTDLKVQKQTKVSTNFESTVIQKYKDKSHHKTQMNTEVLTSTGACRPSNDLRKWQGAFLPHKAQRVEELIFTSERYFKVGDAGFLTLWHSLCHSWFSRPAPPLLSSCSSYTAPSWCPHGRVPGVKVKQNVVQVHQSDVTTENHSWI